MLALMGKGESESQPMINEKAALQGGVDVSKTTYLENVEFLIFRGPLMILVRQFGPKVSHVK